MTGPLRAVLSRLLGREARGFARDSAAVAVSSATVQLGHLVVVVVVTRSLGLAELGRFSLVVSFVALIGQFFDVRIDKAVITFGARRIPSDYPRLAEIVKFGYLVDASTGVLAFAVVAALSGLAGEALVGTDGTTLILLYAITLMLSFGDDTAKGILFLFSRFGVVAWFALGQEVVRIGLVVGALARFHSLRAVVVALVLVDLVAAVAYPMVASSVFARASGGERLRPVRRRAAPKDRRDMVRMIFHTNLVSYAKVIQARGPTLLLGWLTGSAVGVGVYRIGMTAASLLGAVADPALKAVHPRIARLWAAGRRAEVVTLLKQTSRVSFPLMAGLASTLFLARRPLLEAAGAGADLERAADVLAVGMIGYAVSGALFWNTQFLLATGHSGRLALITLGTALAVLVPLLAILIDVAGVLGAALATSVSMVVMNVWAGVEAVRTLLADAPRPSEPLVPSDEPAP